MARIPKRLPRDVNSKAVAIARILTGDDEANVDPRPTDTIIASRTKASKGGSARADSLTDESRRRIATKAAAARWKK